MAVIRCANCSVKINADALGCPGCGADPRTGEGAFAPPAVSPSPPPPRTPVPRSVGFRVLLALPPLALAATLIAGVGYFVLTSVGGWANDPGFVQGLTALTLFAAIVLLAPTVDAVQTIVRGTSGRGAWVRVLLETFAVGVPLCWVTGFPSHAYAYRSPFWLLVLPVIYVACLALYRLISGSRAHATPGASASTS
jgi:hypothetical protein